MISVSCQTFRDPWRRADRSHRRSSVACASASSFVRLPSLRPRAALDVANAWKPSPARMRVELTSHEFGMTKGARAVVKHAEANCLFLLGGTHRRSTVVTDRIMDYRLPARRRHGLPTRNFLSAVSLLGRTRAERTACGRRNRFHEKAGRSQVDSCLASLNNDFFSRRVATVAMLPFALSRSDLFSLGAGWAFSFQPVLLSVWRPVVLLLQSGT
jgi:hypothetical protein